MKPWVKYSLVRLGVFAIVLTALLLLNVTAVLATVIAAVVGLCVGYIFFGKLRAAVVADLADRRLNAGAARSKDADAAAEDAEMDNPAR